MADRNDLRSRILELSPKRLALLALQLQEELEGERAARTEPVAVVGMACRFPGADSTEAYWELLREGRDVVREVPADRWAVDALYDPDPDAPGRIATRWGGYLDDVQGFDAAFFSVSPREARAMDPQQRLLLEVTWRAFEDAGIPPDRHHGSSAGVFVGMCNNDYLTRLLKEGPEAIDAYLSSGNAYSVAAGRISFTFGFQGPAVTVDTACSSSLVALHDACRSLRGRETDLAVAGGVNVMSSPETSMALSRARMMAPDGRCKTFDDAADGFVRAEGCGVLILKRLSDARRDGDRIHAVLRGTAIGQDGRSTGLTVPNGPAQEQVIRDALERSSLRPADVDYIEAHGTGTSLGDPIEIRALGRVFGPGRDRPLVVGSVKTNMGHLESAAGVAGVIKAVLAVREGYIPPHLHFHTPSRHIDWDEFPVEVPAEGRAWPGPGPRRAGVSSFGFSGTNAHVIVEQAPAESPASTEGSGDPGASPAREGAPSAPELLVLSATTPEALDQVTDAFRTALAGLDDGTAFRDLCHTSRTGRTAFPWRRAVVARDAGEAVAALGGVEGAPVILQGRHKVADPPEVAFVFTGQGAQHPGMGRGLYHHDRWFRRAVDECAEILDPLLSIPLAEVLFTGEGDDAPIYTTTLAQPAVVAWEWALTRMWDARGVRPSAVLGHSLGEFAAACVAGVMSLEDTLRLVAERGRLLDSLPRGDRMAAVFAPAERLEALLPPDGGAVIGACNAPESTVISGRADAVAAVVEACRAEGIDSRELRLDRGFHSPRVEPILDELARVAGSVEYRAPSLPLAWNVTGTVSMTAPTAGYWRDHARRPVRFMQGVRALADRGIRHFLEVGPHPALSPLVAQSLDGEAGVVVVASQRRGGDALHDALEATGRLWVEGVDIDATPLADGHRRRRGVPGHPLRRTPYWVDPPADPRPTVPRGAVPGVRLSTPVSIHETMFTPRTPSFLAQHRFRGQAVVPGPLFAEAAVEAARASGAPTGGIADLELLSPAAVDDDGLRLQTILDLDGPEARFRVVSHPTGAEPGSAWSLHARGRLLTGPTGAPPSVQGADADARPVAADAHLARLRELGFELGPDAALWTELRVGPGGASARLLPPQDAGATPVSRALLLDAGAQVLGAALAGSGPVQPRMLAGIDEIGRAPDGGTPVRCVARLDGSGGDVVLFDAQERATAWLRGVRLAPIPERRGDAERWHHRLEWHAAPLEPAGGRLADDVTERAAGRVAATWEDRAREAELSAYVAALPGLRTRVARHVAAALARLGFDGGPGDRIAPDALPAGGVDPAHRRLLPRLLEILAQEGYLEPAPDGSHHIVRALTAPEPGPPPLSGEVDPVTELVERCGRGLADVLAGRVDPLELLFPGGSRETTRAIYRDTAFGRAFNGALADLLAAVADSAAGGGTVRVLEAGAGSGSTTRAALRGLGERSFTYTFTDVSPTLVGRAEAELSGIEGMAFATLDVEADPATQGVEPGSFDVVLAANVVHATADVARSLGHLRSLLAPGGVLVLLEGTRPEAWVDATFGLTAGWWRFTDTRRRPSHPLLDLEGWTAALRDAGFDASTALPDDELARAAGQVILVARRSVGPAATPGLDASRVVDGRGRSPLEVVEALQSALADPDAGRIRMVTEAAQAVVAGDRPDPDQALLWGIGRTVALEHPERWGGLIDVPAGTGDAEVTLVVEAEGRAGDDEDQVAWRDGRRLVPRLVPGGPAADGAEDTPPRIRPGGTWLVTGGLGGLGLKVAEWLAARGAARVVLAGRTAAPEAWGDDDPRRADLAALEQAVDVWIRSLDVTDADAVAGLLAELRGSGPPLRGVVHAAAAFGTSRVRDLTAESLDRVLAAKVRGASHLAAATAGDDLDALVLFSSTTSILGVAGLGAYAAANQYLDALAARERAAGRPVVSVGWGTWDVMRLASDEERERYARVGLRPMAASAALDALGRVLATDACHAVVADVDWDRLRSVYEARRSRPLLSALGGGMGESETGPAPGAAERTVAVADLPPEERREALVGIVEAEVRQVLRLPAGRAVDPEEGFFAMGMDSLMSVELKSRLERRLETRLPSTLTFNHPSIDAVAGHLEERFAAAAPGSGGGEARGVGPAGPGPGAGDGEPAPPSEVAGAATNDLSEGELAAELERRLARLEGDGS